ncbi:MAG: efflux transporter outer membrane subunit [Betaproteobacteria bacterium]|nr:efflux transporter outer membrane subunit [Betaproteobacteria bacterium]
MRIIVALAMLGGCSLAPQYERPTPAIPPTWPAGDAYMKTTEAMLPKLSYRDIFRAPALQILIERALANNQDLKLALANVAVVRGQLRVQRAQVLPRIDGSAGVSADKRSDRSSSGAGGSSDNGDRMSTIYELGVGLTAFELDLFGRLRSLNESALQDYLASEAGVRATRLTLVAEVANAYLRIAADRSLLTIARDTAATAERSVELTRARLAGGIAPRSDLRQAETVLAQAQSDLASLTTIVAQGRNALELLVGSPVSEAELAPSIESIDGMLAELPTGLDSYILLRRPDVLQAEYQLRSFNALIGAARAAFFPRITLTAATGLTSTALSSLFTAGAFSWTVQPSLLLPIFDGGANQGNLEASIALREAATARYQKTIQTAFREVADALARRGTIDDQFEAQTRLEEAARDNYELANARYRQGVESYLSTLDAQRTLYSARRSLVSTWLVRAESLVELYRTIGGDAV